MLRPDQMWYKIGGIVMALAEQLNITPERALDLLYTFGNRYIADEVIAEYRGM